MIYKKEIIKDFNRSSDNKNKEPLIKKWKEILIVIVSMILLALMFRIIQAN